MTFVVNKSKAHGVVEIPASKSHTIRAFFLGMLSDGQSIIKNPLISLDTLSALKACIAFGARVDNYDDVVNGTSECVIHGVAGHPKLPNNVIDVGNSGTTLLIALSIATLIDGTTLFTGDNQIQKRPTQNLINSLNNIGAIAKTFYTNNVQYIEVRGIAKGGTTQLNAITSQYLTSLLISCPLMDCDTTINLTHLNEKPYIDMTFFWLDKLGIRYLNNNYNQIIVYGKQRYKTFDYTIPIDYSSAAFFVVLAVITGGKLTINNIDINDTQGDKEILNIVQSMGGCVTYSQKSVTIQGKSLKGIAIDMNNIPDLLPIVAVAACFAEGTTIINNVMHARIKECDRIKVMCTELKKMGANIEELPDGMVIKYAKLHNAIVDGHQDHRVIMALTIAGLSINNTTTIRNCSAVDVTFPTFKELLLKCGCDIRSI